MLQQALFMMEDLVSNIDNEREIMQNNAKLLEIQASIDTKLVSNLPFFHFLEYLTDFYVSSEII